MLDRQYASMRSYGGRFVDFKVRLSPSKQNSFYLLQNGTPSKIMKNAFYFIILKALLILKIFEVFLDFLLMYTHIAQYLTKLRQPDIEIWSADSRISDITREITTFLK